MTQCEQILHHMQTLGSITSLEAMQKYGIMRLASRITDLRRRGIAITKQIVKGEIGMARQLPMPRTDWRRNERENCFFQKLL